MADMFQRRTSWVEMDEKSLLKSLPIIAAFGELEGLDAHTRSASIRVNPLSGGTKPRRKP
jgi:histidinol dehydrogenase